MSNQLVPDKNEFSIGEKMKNRVLFIDELEVIESDFIHELEELTDVKQNIVSLIEISEDRYKQRLTRLKEKYPEEFESIYKDTAQIGNDDYQMVGREARKLFAPYIVVTDSSSQRRLVYHNIVNNWLFVTESPNRFTRSMKEAHNACRYIPGPGINAKFVDASKDNIERALSMQKQSALPKFLRKKGR